MRLENGILKDVNIPGVTFIVALIPEGRKRRPGISMKSEYITIHNTGCPNVPADNFRRGQLDPEQDQQKSWHFTVDENTIIQHLPITEVGWHAGNKEGNYKSFGIETCERNGSEEVVIKFVPELLKLLKIDVLRVVPHKRWSGKQCPWKILPHWDQFIYNIKQQLVVDKDTAYEKAVQNLVMEGIVGSPAAWLPIEKINLKNVESLIVKIGIRLFDVSTYSQAVDKMYDAGIISNKLIWINKTYTQRNVRDLIVKVSGYLG